MRVCDLAGGLVEHVDIAAGGIDDVFPRLERRPIRGAERSTRSANGSGPAGRSRAKRLSVAVRGAARGCTRRIQPTCSPASAITRSARSSSSTVACRLRCIGTSRPSPRIASRVRQLIGMPSITCVPLVVTMTAPGTCSSSSTPAITERAAFPVHSETISMVRSISGLRGRAPVLSPAVINLGGSPSAHGSSGRVPRSQAIGRHGATRCSSSVRGNGRSRPQAARPRPSSPSAASRDPAPHVGTGHETNVRG